MSLVVDLKDEVYTRILAKQVLNQYTDNNFLASKVWYPGEGNTTVSKLKQDSYLARVYIVGLSSDDTRKLSRTRIYEKIVRVYVGIHSYTDNIDNDKVDSLLTLEEELRSTCRNNVSVPNLEWMSNLAIKDDKNETPFYFDKLLKNIFQSYFVAHYMTVLE